MYSKGTVNAVRDCHTFIQFVSGFFINFKLRNFKNLHAKSLNNFINPINTLKNFASKIPIDT